MMAQKKKKGGLFGGFTSAMDDLAGSIDRGVKSVTTDITNATVNPLGYFQPGNVVMMTSRTTVKCLAVDNKGTISCNIPPLHISNLAAQFQVVPSTYSPTAYKLRNMAYPNFYLAMCNGCMIGNGVGGPECDFYGQVAPASSSVDISEYISFQSAMYPGSFLGVLRTGQLTIPAQTSPVASHTAHFKLKYIKHAELPPPTAQPAYPQPQQQPYPPAQQLPPQQQLPPPGQPGYPPSTPPMQHMPSAPPSDPGQQQQYPLPTAPPPYTASGYPPPQQSYPPQQPSPGMEKKPL